MEKYIHYIALSVGLVGSIQLVIVLLAHYTSLITIKKLQFLSSIKWFLFDKRINGVQLRLGYIPNYLFSVETDKENDTRINFTIIGFFIVLLIAILIVYPVAHDVFQFMGLFGKFLFFILDKQMFVSSLYTLLMACNYPFALIFSGVTIYFMLPFILSNFDVENKIFVTFKFVIISIILIRFIMLLLGIYKVFLNLNFVLIFLAFISALFFISYLFFKSVKTDRNEIGKTLK